MDASHSSIGSKHSVDFNALMASNRATDSGSSRLVVQRSIVLRNWTLSFQDSEIEKEYEKFFLEKNASMWRRANALVFIACTILYIYVIAKNPSYAANYNSLAYDSNGNIITLTACPTGWIW